MPVLRLGIVFIGIVVYAFTYSHFFVKPLLQQLISFAMFVVAALGMIFAGIGSQATALDAIFLMSVAANGGLISFQQDMFVNLTAVIVYCIWFSIGNTGEQLVFLQAFFVSVSGIINLIAAHSTEYYQRRTFALAHLTKTETQKADKVRDSNKLTILTARVSPHVQLLCQMLPSAVVTQLKEVRGSVSDNYQGVSILFCDIKGFTTISASVEPHQVVSMLNRLFSHFDKLTDKHKVFKVQTIGDAYVMVAGLPFEDPSNPSNTKRPVCSLRWCSFRCDQMLT